MFACLFIASFNSSLFSIHTMFESWKYAGLPSYITVLPIVPEADIRISPFLGNEYFSFNSTYISSLIKALLFPLANKSYSAMGRIKHLGPKITEIREANKDNKMQMNKELYHTIKNIQKVTGFLGTSGNPVPVSDKEIDKILGNIKEGLLVPEPSVSFDIGEQVKVCEGPFASFSGLVEEVDEEKSRLKVSVSIFGRPTPIELEYNQVEKA